jgi:hypothetical protein
MGSVGCPAGRVEQNVHSCGTAIQKTNRLQQPAHPHNAEQPSGALDVAAGDANALLAAARGAMPSSRMQSAWGWRHGRAAIFSVLVRLGRRRVAGLAGPGGLPAGTGPGAGLRLAWGGHKCAKQAQGPRLDGGATGPQCATRPQRSADTPTAGRDNKLLTSPCLSSQARLQPGREASGGATLLSTLKR